MISWKEQKLPGKEHLFTSITTYLSTRKVLNDEEKTVNIMFCFQRGEAAWEGQVRESYKDPEHSSWISCKNSDKETGFIPV